MKIDLTRYESLNNYVSFSKNFKQITDLVFAGVYNEIKLQVALLNNADLNNGYFNLFGNEFNMFIQPMTSLSLKHHLQSHRTSPFFS